MSKFIISLISLLILSFPVYSQASNQEIKTPLSKEEKNKLEQEIEELKILLDKDPMRADVHLNLANTYWKLGRVGKPIKHYYAAIKINPNYTEAYYDLANMFFTQGEWDQALSAYQKAITTKPDFAEAYNGEGNAFVDKKDYKNAINSYKKAIELKANYNEAKYNLCSAYIFNAKYSEAITACKEAVNSFEDAQAYNNLGNAYFRTSQLDKALWAYEKALSVNPSLSAAYFNIGAIKLLKDDIQGASQAQKKLETLDLQKSYKLSKLISSYKK